MAIAQYKLNNVLGTMYSEGNVVFTPDANTLIAPVGNKISLYDLKSQKCRCLCFESTHNYTLLAVSPNGELLLALNEIGLVHFINLSTYSLIRSVQLGKLGCIKFSPNGNFIAVGGDRKVFVYRVPSDESVGSAKPDMVRVFKDINGQVTTIDWSYDSELLLVGSADSPMIFVYSLGKYANFKNSVFTNHRDGLLGVFFEDWDYNIYSICKAGFLCKWECSTEPELWEPMGNPNVEQDVGDEDSPSTKKSRENDSEKPKGLTKFHLDKKVNIMAQRFGDEKKQHKSIVTSADISDKREFAVIGFADGVFHLVGLPACELIQELRVTEHTVTTVAFAPRGEWVAIGAGDVGQLLVYDWQAEDYVLKEQGHLDTIQCLDFSSDGLWVVTGAHDGKVKLWKTRNSFSFHTFSAHTSIVTGVAFMQNNRAVISSSLDGTVRAFDVKRDRNFRTFTSPIPAQFCGVTIDSSSTYVASGCVDSFNVYVWHLSSGRFLLEVTGHDAPISAIAFSPKQGSSMLASVSWDKTLRIRDSIETESNTQVVQLEAEGTALAFRPDGKEIAVSMLNGSLTFFDAEEQKSLGSLNCTNHMAVSRWNSDGMLVKKNLEDLSFNSVSYSADGTSLLAGGKSVNLCMYSPENQVVTGIMTLTKNRSLEAPSLLWTQKRANDFGLIDMLEERGKDKDDLKLPGTRATSTSRSLKNIFKVYALKFSPTGNTWAAATTEGVMIFSSDLTTIFNPLGANTFITTETVLEAVDSKQYDTALYMALSLNIPPTITMVLEAIPYDYYSMIARNMPLREVKHCLQHIASILDESSHIQFHMMFLKNLLRCHTHKLIDDLDFIRPVMNSVKKAINARIRDNSEVSEQNKYFLDVADVLECQNLNHNEAVIEPGSVEVKEEPMTTDSEDSELSEENRLW